VTLEQLERQLELQRAEQMIHERSLVTGRQFMSGELMLLLPFSSPPPPEFSVNLEHFSQVVNLRVPNSYKKWDGLPAHAVGIVLGYLVQIVRVLARLADVTLPYCMRYSGSHSSIWPPFARYG